MERTLILKKVRFRGGEEDIKEIIPVTDINRTKFYVFKGSNTLNFSRD